MRINQNECKNCNKVIDPPAVYGKAFCILVAMKPPPSLRATHLTLIEQDTEQSVTHCNDTEFANQCNTKHNASFHTTEGDRYHEMHFATEIGLKPVREPSCL